MEPDLHVAAEVESFVREAFALMPDRLRHIQVIAERVRQSARDINELNPGQNIDEVLAYVAALLHDIGYSTRAAQTGFHPLDGYNFLCAHEARDIAELIVGHSCSPEEAELLGLVLPPPGDHLISSLITYWDMQVKQGGEIVSYDERLADIVRRYGEHSITGRANLDAEQRIRGIIGQIDRLLHKKGQ
ncbi:MAG TPA: HD domain-containing protein [Oligoflexia bacterium]|nr:HD domain-containing protein [Oligoflexia bacterium]